ncbi:MAG: aminotransferase class IV [Deltaproteobacteria bacterium]|jgi:branched-chain amino acid aminotransferase|nr:aminotransferase class IV [Deltaproteobacteria bacterium]
MPVSETNLVTRENIGEKSRGWKRKWHENYLVMYSSVWDGYCAEPELWALPPDDHMAHRGDGVFESFKCVDGKAYCLDEHLERLAASAGALGIVLPPAFARTREILKTAYRLGKTKDIVIRICVSRGPGSFTVNPYDSAGSEYYLITQRHKPPDPALYERGASVVSAPFPAKVEFAGIKSCDYLHNVLVKKHAKDMGADHAVSYDPEGFLTEGPTENAAVVTDDGKLLAPPWEKILKGITLSRVMDLAKGLVGEGKLKFVGNGDIKGDRLPEGIREAFLTTTSFNVLPVTLWNGKKVGDGKPGPVARELGRLIEEEIRGNGPRATPLD